jgi:hypothetical protein
MKVGDLVVQGSRVAEFKVNGKPRIPSTKVGIVLAIDDESIFPPLTKEESEHTTDAQRKRWESWEKFLGRRVDVLWPSGKITKRFAENSLEVISEADISS